MVQYIKVYTSARCWAERRRKHYERSINRSALHNQKNAEKRADRERYLQKNRKICKRREQQKDKLNLKISTYQNQQEPKFFL